MSAADNPENRWITAFGAAMMKAFEAIEDHLEHHAGDSPAALLTVSESPKFFSNGIDPNGQYTKKKVKNAPTLTKQDKAETDLLMMPGFIRPLQLPIPTVAAVNGHAFGAGMMFAVGHDYRFQRADRGFMCAIEVEIGVGIPPPEMSLFKHAMDQPSFYATVMGAKRWTAQEALRAGLITKACPEETLFQDALAFAEKQARLAKGPRGRALYMSIKNQAKGWVSREVMEYNFPKGSMPKAVSRVPGTTEQVRQRYPYFLKHIGEEIEPVPGGMVVPQRAKL